ncbi:peptidase [Spiroplasma litorale]|uniref:Peptidase n=1 Tax=Spiroplasma litorale TaxID=216942 RepID=A0A0K1W2V9_9MOLU|nr:caspase family protein [Spiroplasma litorale]AKX34659.1 peptidase [Spiroplasma litorale]
MRKALIVGINDYKHVNPLKECINDAKKIAELLKKNFDNSRNFDVELITNSNELTVSKLSDKINELFAGDSDVALFYFSGHGFIDYNSDKSYLCTYETDENNHGLEMGVVENIISKSNAKNKIVFLDCCYSGMMGNTRNENGIAKSSILYDNTTYLTASKKDETSVETKEGGIFTNLLVEALSGSASDILGVITPASIYSYIDKSLGAWDQRPIFKTSSSKFIDIRKVNPQIDIKIIRNLVKYFEKPSSKYSLNPSFEETRQEHKKENVIIFKELQKLVSVGLVKPDDEEYMYYAAINSKSCSLTMLGKNYWKWVNETRI